MHELFFLLQLILFIRSDFFSISVQIVFQDSAVPLVQISFMQIGKFVVTSRGAGSGLSLTDGPGQQWNPVSVCHHSLHFPLPTAQQLLVGILIIPIQLRSNLSSNSANMTMEWPQSQSLQVQVAQRLSTWIGICRDLCQQISLCQQPGREINLLPCLGSSFVVLSPLL